MLVNGIGFGHFKRALVIADAFDKSEYDVRFIVQASATDIFRGRDYPVYAFPLLYSIKHNNGREVIYSLINSLISKLGPSVVFEDTYPEDDYLNIPALYNIPRMLIIRRVDSNHLDNLFFDGYLSSYDMLLFMEKKERILDKISNPAVKTYLNYSENCNFVGDIFDKVENYQKDRVIKKYCLLQYKKNVVFNCGAGGWHKGINICKKIFDDGLKAVSEIADTHPEYQFVFVTGPYSGWSIPDSKNKKNIRIEQYEENLSSLFQGADVCIIRPGYNAVMECLAGDCDIILLPNISYMEKQDEWCNQLVKEYGLCSVQIGDIEGLHDTIYECLLNHRRNAKRVKSNENLIVDHVMRFLTQIEKCEKKCVLTISNKAFSQGTFGEICIQDKCMRINGKSYPIINLESQTNMLKYIGRIVVIYNDEGHNYESLQSICKKINLFCYGIIPIEVYELKYTTFNNAMLKIHTMLKRGIVAINIVLDESKDGRECEFINVISNFIDSGEIKIMDVKDLVQNYMMQKYHFQYGFNSIGIKGVE